MNVINPAQLTFNGQEIREFAEATVIELLEYPAMNELHTVVPNIVAKQQIAILGHMSKITKKDAGCGQGKTNPQIPMSEKFWNPVDMKIWIQECWTTFKGTFMVYYLNKGKEKPDLTTTDIFSQWLIEEVGQAAARDAMRIAWFADTAAALVSGGGVFTTASVDITDYNQLDGFWKQIFAIVAAEPARKTSIAKNGGATYVLQTFDATDTANQVATNIFLNMTFEADPRLAGKADAVFWATRTMTNQYIRERLANDKIQLAYERLESGIQKLEIMGYPVYVMDQWDEVIKADQNNGTKWNLPHRVVFSRKNNLPIGVDEEQALSDFNVWYSKDDELANIKGLYKIDAKVLLSHEIQVAY